MIYKNLKEIIAKHKENMPVIATAELLAEIDEAEADVCVWKFFKPSNSLYEKHGDFRTGDELEKWNVCPYCGKPIKISEVE